MTLATCDDNMPSQLTPQQFHLERILRHENGSESSVRQSPRGSQSREVPRTCQALLRACGGSGRGGGGAFAGDAQGRRRTERTRTAGLQKRGDESHRRWYLFPSGAHTRGHVARHAYHARYACRDAALLAVAPFVPGDLRASDARVRAYVFFAPLAVDGSNQPAGVDRGV